MAEQAERVIAEPRAKEAEPPRAKRAVGMPVQHGLQRRAAAREAGYGALLNSRQLGPRPTQRPAPPNRAGLPGRLKAGVEALAGMSMDGVKVHYNSSRPAQLDALAYAQGTDIHLGPGQEGHLPHEAWHVVQQARGRVRPTAALRTGAAVNDDAGLEREADTMGARALRAGADGRDPEPMQLRATAPVVQRVIPGLDLYVVPEKILPQWVAAYIADIEAPTAHLYELEIWAYLKEKDPNWLSRAKLLNHGSHWDVVFTSGNTVRTRADGNCGAHAIHALLNNDGAQNIDNYESPPNFAATVRAWMKPGIESDETEIRKRIAERIKECDAVAEAGFGPQLTDLLTPFQEEAARQDEMEQKRQAALSATVTNVGNSLDSSPPSSSSLSTDELVALARGEFSGFAIADIELGPSATPGAKASEFAGLVEKGRLAIQAFADKRAPGLYSCVVRFHVLDENVGKTHPGLNSWAYLEAKKTGKPVAEVKDRAGMAKEHMDFGHDIGGSKDDGVLEKSHFVSGTDDVGALIKADSPDNPARSKALISNAAVDEFKPGGSKTSGRAMPLRPTLGKSGPAKAPSRKGGKFVSDRIIYLTHGVENAKLAKNLKVPVATHIAFLLVPKESTYRPAEGTSPDMCCVLEHEVTIFAPDVDLAQFVVAEVENKLPELTGRFRS